MNFIIFHLFTFWLFSALQSELLLSESSDVVVPVSRAVVKSWDEDAVLFANRMGELIFSRSESQLRTPPDGNCGLWAALGNTQ